MKEKDLKYDFLPSYLEIIDKPSNPAGCIIIVIISTFIIGLIILSYLFKIDVKINTVGQIVPVDGLNIVNTNLSGKIISIDKKVGDKVKQGEVILSIENKDIEKNIENINKSISLKNLDFIIAKNKLENKDSYEEINNSDLSEGEKQEIIIKQELFWDNIKQQEDRYIEQIEEVKNKIKKSNQKIKELEEQYNNLTDVDFILSGENILKEIDDKKKEIENLNKEMENLKSSKEKSNKQNRLDLISQVNQLEKDLLNLEEQLKSANEKSTSFNIVSPVDGTILNMNYNTIGSYLGMSAQIAEIVPDNSKCSVLTTIDNKYISKVEIGQEVMVKIDAYDFQKYGGLKGKIEYISPTAILDEKTGQAVYQIKIGYENLNEKIEVLPGMLSNIEINVERVRLIEYFLSPFFDVAENAF